MPRSSSSSGKPARHAGRAWRAAGLLALAAVLGLAFAGYLSPDMKLEWENLMALCGF